MNRILPILFTLLLAGCIGPRADRPVRADVPPMPPLTVDGEWLMADGPVPAAVVPLPPPRITILADPSFGATGYVLFAASVPFLSSMVPHATNTAPEFTEPATEPQRFYQMKAINDHGLSDWATQ